MQRHNFVWPCQKVKYHYISITKSISKVFKPNLCVFSQMKDKKYLTGFSFGHLGHGTWWEVEVRGGGGGIGESKFNFSEIQPSLVCELLT